MLCKLNWRSPIHIPRHALHEQKYTNKESAGPLVSSQERALVVARFNRSLCSSIGLRRISFVRASGESLRTVAFNLLRYKRDACFLDGQTRWRPVLPLPAPPRCPAVRRPVPTRPWYVQALDSSGDLTSDAPHARHVWKFQDLSPIDKSTDE